MCRSSHPVPGILAIISEDILVWLVHSYHNPRCGSGRIETYSVSRATLGIRSEHIKTSIDDDCFVNLTSGHPHEVILSRYMPSVARQIAFLKKSLSSNCQTASIL